MKYKAKLGSDVVTFECDDEWQKFSHHEVECSYSDVGFGGYCVRVSKNWLTEVQLIEDPKPEPQFAWGDRVEVRDGESSWMEAIYLGYIERQDLKYSAVINGAIKSAEWKHCRPLVAKEIEFQEECKPDQPMAQQPFEDNLRDWINTYSKENGSDTPDFILADYLNRALFLLDSVINQREAWYGRNKTKSEPPSKHPLPVAKEEEGADHCEFYRLDDDGIYDSYDTLRSAIEDKNHSTLGILRYTVTKGEPKVEIVKVDGGGK